MKKASNAAPSPIELMMEKMNEDRATTGMSAHIKRKLPDGSYVDADAKQLSSLGTKSRIAYASENLKRMSPEERNAWALEMKDYANALYAEQRIQDAMEKYVEALSASDFGQKKETNGSSRNGGVDIDGPRVVELSPIDEIQEEGGDDNNRQSNDEEKSNSNGDNNDDNKQVYGNMDTLIIPVLCNLAACCIQLRNFSKAVKFAESALDFRPNCGKALMRRGMSFVQIGEFDQSIQDLERCLLIKTEDEASADENHMSSDDAKMRHCMPLSENDKLRIPILINKARTGKQREAKQMAKRNENLQKVFGGPPPSAQEIAEKKRMKEEMEQQRVQAEKDSIMTEKFRKVMAFFTTCGVLALIAIALYYVL